MREEIKAIEKLNKTAEQLEKGAQAKEKKRTRTLNIRKPSYRITSIRRQMLFPEKIAMRSGTG